MSDAISYIWCHLADYYAENLRSNLFSGLLTIGAFLFAVKTFIVVKLKEDVFDTEYYRTMHSQRKKEFPDLCDDIYAPLKRLSQVLFLAEMVSLSGAILQVSVGLIPSSLCALVCIVWAIVGIALLSVSVFLVKQNLDIWIKNLPRPK